jgi:hypothetical protein
MGVSIWPKTFIGLLVMAGHGKRNGGNTRSAGKGFILYAPFKGAYKIAGRRLVQQSLR